MKLDEFISNVFSKFYEQSFKEMQYERTAFDPISRVVFEQLVSVNLRFPKEPKVSSLWLSKLVNVSVWKVRTRLIGMAQYGIIRVTYRYKNGTNGINDTSIIEVNPILMGIYSNNAGMKHIVNFVQHYCKRGIERYCQEEGTLQGFHVDCLYGKSEPDGEYHSTPWENRLVDMIATKDENKAVKRREEFDWMNMSKSFIDGCGAIWTKAQGEMGYGYNKAAWDGEMTDLGPTPKRERSELVKLFQNYGGFDTGLAWYIFCCGIPQKDDNGRLQFDLRSPHRQFVSTDKKPSQFAKHFNAILADDIFVDFKNNADEITVILEKYYGDLTKIGPRYEQIKTDI